jgi:hypothetical protein
VRVSLLEPSADQLAAIVEDLPMVGGTLSRGIERRQQRPASSAYAAKSRWAYVEGETVDQIVRRVVGTKAAGYRDGVLAVSRRDASGPWCAPPSLTLRTPRETGSTRPMRTC